MGRGGGTQLMQGTWKYNLTKIRQNSNTKNVQTYRPYGVYMASWHLALVISHCPGIICLNLFFSNCHKSAIVFIYSTQHL